MSLPLYGKKKAVAPGLSATGREMKFLRCTFPFISYKLKALYLNSYIIEPKQMLGVEIPNVIGRQGCSSQGAWRSVGAVVECQGRPASVASGKIVASATLQVKKHIILFVGELSDIL